MLLGESFKSRAADLFFTFNEKFDSQWQGAAHLLIGVDRTDTGGDVPLVIGDATSDDAPVYDLGSERLGVPEFERLRRLNIVVVVETKGSVPVADFTVDDRISAFDRHDLGLGAD